MRKILIIFLAVVLLVFLLPSISSLTFDNRIRDYDEETKTIIIDDNFGLGGDLVKIKLEENTYICGVECYAIWNVTIYKDDDNFLTDLIFEQIEGTGGVSEHRFEIITSYETIIANEYGKDCTKRDELNQCKRIITGTHEEQIPIWSAFNPERKLPIGNYIIKLTGTKRWDDTIDWIPTFYGKEIRQWAFWASTNPSAYYNFNEADGATEAIDFLGLKNLTVTDLGESGFAIGKLANAFNSTTTNGFMASNTTGGDQFAFGTDDFTVAFWLNSSGTGGAAIIEIGRGSTERGWSFNRAGSNLEFVYNGTLIFTETPNVFNDLWNRIVVVRSGTGSDQTRFYINGVNTDNTTFASAVINNTGTFRTNGLSQGIQLDDLQIYNNFAWSVADVAFDYNNGNGREANTTSGVPTINVVLNLPVNGTSISTTSLTFQATITPELINMTNATLILSNSTNGATLVEDFVLMGTGSNISEFNLTDLDLITYHWNVLTCGISTGTGDPNCNVAFSNFTLTIGIQEIVSFFVNETIEGDTTSFQINVSIPDGRQISTNNLHYNNTINAGTRTLIAGNNFSIITTQAAPLVSEQTNISFFWNITLDNGIEFNSALNNQSVIALSADDCTTNGLLILNYTLQDEGTQVATVPDGGTTNSTMQISLTISIRGTDDSIITFSQNYTNTNPAQVCLNQINDSIFDMDSQVRYEFTDHVVEFNNIQNFTLRNSSIPQNINLLDLATVDSQEFLITFKDIELLPLAGALIDITRKYISEGVFKTVELPLTDDEGQVLGHLVLSDEIYTFIVSKDGIVLGTFQNVIAFCDNQATGDCKINLNVFGEGFSIPDFNTIGNLNLETTYDRSTRVITTLFTTIDGSVVTVNVNGTLNDALGNQSVCSDSLTSSSGTLTCTVPNSFGNSSVLYQVFNSETLVGQSVFSTQLTPAEIFGGTRIILVIILFSTVSLMALTSGPATLFLAFMAMVMASLLNLFIGGSLIGETSILLWFAIAIGILLFKMSRRDAT